jgi:hypothetical protein
MKSGTELLAFALMIPFMAIIAGVSIEHFNRYRPQNLIGWIFIVIGFGLLTMLEPGTSRAISSAYQVILGIGFGILWIATQFPVMAPLPVSNNSHALAFFTFVRVFAQVRLRPNYGARLRLT